MFFYDPDQLKINKSVYLCDMFRQIITLIFLSAFLVQTFNKPFIVLDYFANTAAFAKNCVNKARPKMHCNGKCQMMKKLQEEEKKEQKNEDRKAAYKYEVLSSRSFFSSISHPVLICKTTFSLYKEAGVSAISRSIFHPPGA
jgi:hypothetical protein